MSRVLFAISLVALASACSEASNGHGPSPSEPKPFAWSEVTPCPAPRFEALGVVVGRELWVMGGFLSTKLDVTRRIDIYDPGSDTWRLGRELPGAETHAGVADVGDDFVLVGGFVGNVHDRVTTAAMWRWSAIAALIDDRLIVSSGSPTSTDPSATTYVGCCL